MPTAVFGAPLLLLFPAACSGFILLLLFVIELVNTKEVASGRRTARPNSERIGVNNDLAEGELRDASTKKSYYFVKHIHTCM